MDYTTNPILGISVVNYFSSTSVVRLVESLISASDEVRVIVSIIDNSVGDSDSEHSALLEMAQRLQSSNFQIHVTRSPANLGYGAGNNAAARLLTKLCADYIWVLNPDIIVSGNLSEMLNEVSGQTASIWATRTVENGEAGYGFGTLNTFTGKGSTSTVRNRGRSHFSLAYPAGHSIIFTRKTWESLGGFDERYFLFMEEADMTLRALASGIAIGEVATLSVLHSQGLTTGSTQDLRAKSTVAYRESTRSRVLFFRRFFPLRLPVFILFRLIYALIVKLKGNGSGSRAVLEGLGSGMRYSETKITNGK